MELEQAFERYHQAAGEFGRGNPEPFKSVWSQRDDVILANPFGPAVRGWDKVSEALDYASSRFADGDLPDFEIVARYVSGDLATIFANERWRARVAGGDEISTMQIRVTSTFRLEGDDWKLVHRHADPIATADDQGPLRRSFT
jgi:ketosteroid isomerase-like protein